MYSTTSKPQGGSTCKDSLPKCFMTVNSTAKLSRGAVNRDEVLRTCFHLNFYTSIKQYILLKYLYKTQLFKESFLSIYPTRNVLKRQILIDSIEFIAICRSLFISFDDMSNAHIRGCYCLVRDSDYRVFF